MRTAMRAALGVLGAAGILSTVLPSPATVQVNDRAPKSGGACDLTGTWVDQASQSRQYTNYLKSEGGRITGATKGPNQAPGAYLGKIRSDGTIQLAFNPVIPGAPPNRMSLRANADCTRLTGTYKYAGLLGYRGPRSGAVDLVKQ